MLNIRNDTKIKTKKSLGQNFLRDPKILKKIVDFAKLNPEDTVLEIGPGEGTLTSLLINQAGKVIAVEKDEALAKALREKFEQEIKDGKLEVVEGDILELRAESLGLEGREVSTSKLEPLSYKLLGNIPYNITGAIFKKFLESENPPKSITFVIQREVAERILAKDNKESILSISIKAYGKPEFGGIIKAGSFYPAPKVDSGIVAVRDISPLSLRSSPLTLRGESEQKFFTILKAGFAHKRKLLIKNLQKLPLCKNKDLSAIFEKIGIDKKARAEDLGVNDWFDLTKDL